MERNYAILIADLSGYTSLTETHGAMSAADLIDTYIKVVNESLYGSSYLQERVGDEVLILADDVNDLLSTTEQLCNRLAEQDLFLQIHGGLHYGSLLKRNNAFFGSALNVTSRIASAARPGSILCSKDFLSGITPEAKARFTYNSKLGFKNVTQKTDTFEMRSKNQDAIQIDPVCRMVVFKNNGLRSHSKPGLLFCSQECADIYSKIYETENNMIY